MNVQPEDQAPNPPVPTPTPTPSFAYGDWMNPVSPDPLDAACEQHEGDTVAAIESLGYRLWSGIGDAEGVGGTVPITLEVYSRSGAEPRFLVQIHGNSSWIIEHVYVRDLPSMMQLLAVWAPAAQAAALTDLTARLGTGKLEDGALRGVVDAARRIGDGALGQLADKVDDLRRAIQVQTETLVERG